MAYLDWKVGDKVVCVSVPDDRGWGHQLPEIRRIYTIREIGVGLGGDVVVKLAEIHNPRRTYNSTKFGRTVTGEVCFGARHFRPVQTRKTDISQFTAMLHDQRQKVPAA